MTSREKYYVHVLEWAGREWSADVTNKNVNRDGYDTLTAARHAMVSELACTLGVSDDVTRDVTGGGPLIQAMWWAQLTKLRPGKCIEAASDWPSGRYVYRHEITRSPEARLPRSKPRCLR